MLDLTAVDLRLVHGLVSYLGIMVVIYQMQLMVFDPANKFLTMWMIWLRRGALGLVGLALCASVYIAHAFDWNPWWPDVMLVASLDLYFIATIVSTHIKMWQDNYTIGDAEG